MKVWINQRNTMASPAAATPTTSASTTNPDPDVRTAMPALLGRLPGARQLG